MRRRLLRTLYTFMALFAVLFALGWVFLVAPFFSPSRRALVERVLSEQIAQPLRIRGDVSVVLGPVSRIHVRGVEIPSETTPGITLAELNRLDFDLDLVAFGRGNPSFDNLTMDGLQVNLVTLEDGTTSWAPVSKLALFSETDTLDLPDQDGGKGILAFLRGKNATFSTIGLSVEDRRSGFTFLFDLVSLTLEQRDNGRSAVLTGRGSVNGQKFSIDGDYPTDAPFAVTAQFGQVGARLDGLAIPPEDGGGYRARLELDTDDLGGFLELLGLKRELEGLGRLSADVIDTPESLSVEHLEALILLPDGQKVSAHGGIENLRTVRGIDLSFLGRFYPDNRLPPVADRLSDLKLTGFDAQVVGAATALEFPRLVLRTNGFDHGLEEVGPASIGRIRRTSEGYLEMQDVSLQAGPSDDPYLIASGEVLDLLRLRDLRFDGTLSAPAGLVLSHLGKDGADAFGKVEANFEIDDSGGPLALKRLEARSLDSEIWSLEARLIVDHLMKLGGLEFDMNLSVPDGARFLSALGLAPVDMGALGVDASLRGRNDTVSSTLGFVAGGSHFQASLDTTAPDGSPVVRGKVESDLVDLGDLKNLNAALRQLGSLSDRSASAPDSGVRPRARPKDTVEPEIQPLELPKRALEPSDFLGIGDILTTSDVEVAIDFRKITGQEGMSSIASKFVAKGSKLHLGPVDIAFGGGQFSLTMSMDPIKAPETLSVSGNTSGWDLGRVLQRAGVKVDGRGTISGTFDLTGNMRSVRVFVRSMKGTATVSMSNGRISTSLLELAGLGVVPWLFSEELRQGYTDIGYIQAPLRIDPGRVSSSSFVAETNSVQLVATGSIDWKNDRISVHAEPKAVGNGLALKARPFDVTGTLSAPTVKLAPGGSVPRLIDRTPKRPGNRPLRERILGTPR